MKKVIIDCDPGHDDAIALLLAAKSEELKLVGVTTVAGNSELHNTTRNARKILDYAGYREIPVYSGCNRPMMRDLFRLTGAIIHGEDGLGGPDIPAPVTPIQEEHAVDYLIRTLKDSDDRIILIVTGPMTNIAVALQKAPEIKDKIDRIIMMGGAVIEPGNITSAAEFNIFVDPEAAKIVINSGCELYLVTLDVTMKAVFNEDDIETLRSQGDKFRPSWHRCWILRRDPCETFGFKACPIHDALCVGILIDDSLVEFKKTHVDISLHDPLTLGETVADLWEITGNKPNCHISMKVDREKFVKMICDHMKK
jgi:inosine-uridine nucleoside N-ribohydrolase